MATTLCSIIVYRDFAQVCTADGCMGAKSLGKNLLDLSHPQQIIKPVTTTTFFAITIQSAEKWWWADQSDRRSLFRMLTLLTSGVSNRWTGIWNGTVEWNMEWNGGMEYGMERWMYTIIVTTYTALALTNQLTMYYTFDTYCPKRVILIY